MWPSHFQFGRLSFGGEISWVLRVFYLNWSLSSLPSRLSLLISLDTLYQFLLFSFHVMTNLFTRQDSNGEGMTVLSPQPCTNSQSAHLFLPPSYPSSLFQVICLSLHYCVCVCAYVCIRMFPSYWVHVLSSGRWNTGNNLWINRNRFFKNDHFFKNTSSPQIIKGRFDSMVNMH